MTTKKHKTKLKHDSPHIDSAKLSQLCKNPELVYLYLLEVLKDPHLSDQADYKFLMFSLDLIAEHRGAELAAMCPRCHQDFNRKPPKSDDIQ